eukprot:jgi/Chlat1/1109/Chrsp110S01550
MSASLEAAWESWLDWSLTSLRESRLERTLRTVIPGASATEVLVPAHVLTSWLQEEDEIEASTTDKEKPPPPRRLQEQQQQHPPSSPSALDNQSSSSGDAILHRLRLFSGNDYLALSCHAAVRSAAAGAAAARGMGPRSSALVCGYTEEHAALEEDIARLKGTEACLLCPTGFAANLAAITALCSIGKDNDHNHHHHNNTPVALVLGTYWRFSPQADAAPGSDDDVVAVVGRHNDMEHLEQLLAACRAPRKLVVTDSLFSMDGDFADLKRLAELRTKHGFLLVIDEAHATLVCGKHGGGAAEEAGVSDQVDVHVGTLSKAIGCHGGFIASSRHIKRLLTSRSRAFVYSTSLPSPVVSGARAAITVGTSHEGERMRERLRENVERLSRALGVKFESPIAPLVLGSEKTALAVSRHLLRAGFHVPAIRPPTVAPGTSRLRIALSSAHSPRDIDDLAAAIKEGLAAVVSTSTATPSPRQHDRSEEVSLVEMQTRIDSRSSLTCAVASKL